MIRTFIHIELVYFILETPVSSSYDSVPCHPLDCGYQTLPTRRRQEPVTISEPVDDLPVTEARQEAAGTSSFDEKKTAIQNQWLRHQGLKINESISKIQSQAYRQGDGRTSTALYQDTMFATSPSSSQQGSYQKHDYFVHNVATLPQQKNSATPTLQTSQSPQLQRHQPQRSITPGPLNLPNTHVQQQFPVVALVQTQPPVDPFGISNTPIHHVGRSTTPVQYVGSDTPLQHIDMSNTPVQHVGRSNTPVQPEYMSNIPVQHAGRSNTPIHHQSQRSASPAQKFSHHIVTTSPVLKHNAPYNSPELKHKVPSMRIQLTEPPVSTTSSNYSSRQGISLRSPSPTGSTTSTLATTSKGLAMFMNQLEKNSQPEDRKPITFNGLETIRLVRGVNPPNVRKMTELHALNKLNTSIHEKYASQCIHVFYHKIILCML